MYKQIINRALKQAVPLVISLCAMFGSLSAQAALITESLRADSTPHVVMDTNTGKRWLSFHETKGMSIQTVSSLLTTTFAGWRIADLADVEELFFAHFEGTVSFASSKRNELYNVTKSASSQIAEMYFGFGHNEKLGGLTSIGFYLNANSATNGLGSVVIGGVNYTEHRMLNGENHIFLNNGNYSTTYTQSGIGTYLVKDRAYSVPEVGVGFVFMGLLLFAHRKTFKL